MEIKLFDGDGQGSKKPKRPMKRVFYERCESCLKTFDSEKMVEAEQWFCKPCYKELSTDDEFLHGNAAYEFFDSNYFDAESIEDIMRKHCKPDFVWEVDNVSDADKIKIYLIEKTQSK